jgi:large subunit ribosomal protein L9
MTSPSERRSPTRFSPDTIATDTLMPKTEVILTSNIVGLGAESDQVKVAAGYARNYLFPQGLAIPLTGANKRRLEVLRQRRAEREAHELNTMMDLAKSISKLIALIHVKSGDDGKMFGSVTSGTIADTLKTQFDISLDKRKIHLEKPIHALGDYEVELRLHPEVTTSMKVRVESITPPPTLEEQPAAEGAKGTRVTEKRSRRPERPEGKPEEKPEARKAEKPVRPVKAEKPAKTDK